MHRYLLGVNRPGDETISLDAATRQSGALIRWTYEYKSSAVCPGRTSVAGIVMWDEQATHQNV